MTYEDFTTYTEVDEDGDITKIASKVSWTNITRSDESYVYKDHGIGHFGDIDHDFEMKMISCDDAGRTAHWVLSNEIDDFYHTLNNNLPGLAVRTEQTGSVYMARIYNLGDGANDTGNILVNTLYYCTVTRVDTTLVLKIYSDAPRSVLVDTLTVTCTDTTLRYLYPCSAWNDSSAGENHAGFTQNLDLKAGLEPIALFDSVNVSDNVVFKHELNLSDSITVTDSVSYIDKYLVALFDAVSISDTITFKHLLTLADSINVDDTIAFKHLLNLADSIGITDSTVIKYLIALSDSVNVSDAIIFKHLLNLLDSINITDSIEYRHSIFILDNISILDDIDITIFDECSSIFQLQGDSYTVFLPTPNYGGESGSLNIDLALFDFWINTRSVDNLGINTEPIILGGTIFACSDNEETEMTAIATKFLNIHEMMDNNEEVSIRGLNECVDAVYVIKDFKYGTIDKSPYAYTWQLTLEYKRAL